MAEARGNDIPVDPSELTPQEVDRILDPGAVGVYELSPLVTVSGLARELEAQIETAQGDDAFALRREHILLTNLTDRPSVEQRALELLEDAKASGSLAALADAYIAMIPGTQGSAEITAEDRKAYAIKALEIYAHLGDQLGEAHALYVRGIYEKSVDRSPKVAVQTFVAAHAKALSATGDPKLRHYVLGALNGAFAELAWAGERDLELARRYHALAVLHSRRTNTPCGVGDTHRELGNAYAEIGSHELARTHLQRAEHIFEHHEEWALRFEAIGFQTFGHIRLGNIPEARKAETRLRRAARHVENEVMRESILSTMSALIDAQEGDVASASGVLLETAEDVMVPTEVRMHSLDVLADAYAAAGDYKMAFETTQRRTVLERQENERKLSAGLIGFVLSRELNELKEAHEQTEAHDKRHSSMLQSILPPSAYREFEATGTCEARFYENVVIFFSDFADFTRIASGMPPQQVMQLLSELFDAFDQCMAAHGCERVETIGDAYLAVAGLEDADTDHAAEVDRAPVEVRMARAALDVAAYLETKNAEYARLGSPEFTARIGIHTGSIVGGLVGNERQRFAIFGDAVNTAQRLEAGGRPGAVTVSDDVMAVLRDYPEFEAIEPRAIEAKGKGSLDAWEIRRLPASAAAGMRIPAKKLQTSL